MSLSDISANCLLLIGIPVQSVTHFSKRTDAPSPTGWSSETSWPETVPLEGTEVFLGPLLRDNLCSGTLVLRVHQPLEKSYNGASHIAALGFSTLKFILLPSWHHLESPGSLTCPVA